MSTEKHWSRVARTPGVLYSTSPSRAAKRRRCDGHLVDPHWIEIGDHVIHSAVPPNHPDIGNIGWWHSTFCIRCAPEAVTR